MRREIKFEAWDTIERVMIPCQFTGLKDNHGKEIYEGDVIVHNGINEIAENNRILEVQFLDGAFCVTALKHVNGCDRSVTIRDLMFEARRYGTELELEVIGNIYENPDLLDM